MHSSREATSPTCSTLVRLSSRPDLGGPKPGIKSCWLAQLLGQNTDKPQYLPYLPLRHSFHTYSPSPKVKMVKYAPVWTSFLLLGTWTALSIQVSFEETVRADVPQLVYKRGDSSPDWIGSLDDFLPKVRSYA